MTDDSVRTLCDHPEGGGWIDTDNGSELRCLLCGEPMAKGWTE